MSQQTTLLKHLKYSPITKLQALRMYGILNTGDCILLLRKKGHNIITKMIPRHDKAAYAEYRLETK